MKKNILKLAMASLLAVGTTANAAVITDSFFIDHQTAELTSGLFSLNGSQASGSLNQFDSSLGTLTGISITLSGESISSGWVKNTSSVAQNFSVSSQLNFYFEVIDNMTNVTRNFEDAVGGFSTVLADIGNSNFFGTRINSGETLNIDSTTDQFSSVYVIDQDAMARFIGSETINIGCNTQAGTTMSGGGGNLSFSQSTTASCGAEISYTYDDVQIFTTTSSINSVFEPTVLALLGLGLFGMGLNARRKTK